MVAPFVRLSRTLRDSGTLGAGTQKRESAAKPVHVDWSPKYVRAFTQNAGEPLLDKAKEVAIDKGKDLIVDKVSSYADHLFKLSEKEQLRHLEQALENATE